MHKITSIFAVAAVVVSVYAQSAPQTEQIQRSREKKRTETYKILDSYGFLTNDYISIDPSQFRSESILGVYIKDDGEKCFLDREYVTFKSGSVLTGLTTPEHMDITGCIKEILWANEDDKIRHAFVLIECKDSPDRNVLLMNMRGQNFFRVWIQGLSFLEVSKDYTLKGYQESILDTIETNEYLYDSEELEWYITKY